MMTPLASEDGQGFCGWPREVPPCSSADEDHQGSVGKFSLCKPFARMLNALLGGGQSGTPGHIGIKPFPFCTRKGGIDKSSGKEKAASEMQVSEERAREREPSHLPSARPHTTQITVYFFHPCFSSRLESFELN